MVQFIRPTNRKSFKPRYRKYLTLRSDIWGRVALLNKKNGFTEHMKRFIFKEMMSRIKKLPLKRKIRIYKKLKMPKLKKRQFEYKVVEKAEPKEKPRLTKKQAVYNLHKKIKYFYHLHFKRKSLRKFL